jgi:DNA invertase Pin-like site-specific DNA recombinase
MIMTAFGYIRKSVVHDEARMLSPETQEAAIRSLAARHADTDVVILSDLDISGRKDRRERPGWDELLHAVENGNASAVYAYSLSRFARSVSQLLEFFDLCRTKKVSVRMERDQIDTSTAMGTMTLTILAAIAEMEANVASERVKDAFIAKRLNDTEWRGPGNRKYGVHEGEDVDLLMAAFREAGSFDGAARILNERAVPTRRDDAVWHGTTVSAIVRREHPDEVAPTRGRGAKAGRRNFRFARLLACGTCGTRLTGSLDGRSSTVRYYCHRAKVTPHVRGWLTEARLLPTIVAEAQRAARESRRHQKGNPDDEAALAALAAKRAVVIDFGVDGIIEKGEVQGRLADIAFEEAKLTSLRWLRRITIAPVFTDTVDDDGKTVMADDPARINDYLRRLFERVTVDMSAPAGRGPASRSPTLHFEWRDPLRDRPEVESRVS